MGSRGTGRTNPSSETKFLGANGDSENKIKIPTMYNVADQEKSGIDNFDRLVIPFLKTCARASIR